MRTATLDIAMATLVFHAVPEDSLDAVRALVDDIDASPDIRGVHGNRALD